MQILIIAMIVLVVCVVLAFNKLINLINSVQASANAIQFYLQQRFDLLPNLVDVIQGYVKYEKEILEKVTELRAISKTNIRVANEINTTFTQLYTIAENNPNLSTGKKFLDLQQNLIKMETQLQAACRTYNLDVIRLNSSIKMFPLNIFAGLFGIRRGELFSGHDVIEPKKLI